MNRRASALGIGAVICMLLSAWLRGCWEPEPAIVYRGVVVDSAVASAASPLQMSASSNVSPAPFARPEQQVTATGAAAGDVAWFCLAAGYTPPTHRSAPGEPAPGSAGGLPAGALPSPDLPEIAGAELAPSAASVGGYTDPQLIFTEPPARAAAGSRGRRPLSVPAGSASARPSSGWSARAVTWSAKVTGSAPAHVPGLRRFRRCPGIPSLVAPAARRGGRLRCRWVRCRQDRERHAGRGRVWRRIRDHCEVATSTKRRRRATCPPAPPGRVRGLGTVGGGARP